MPRNIDESCFLELICIPHLHTHADQFLGWANEIHCSPQCCGKILQRIDLMICRGFSQHLKNIAELPWGAKISALASYQLFFHFFHEHKHDQICVVFLVAGGSELRSFSNSNVKLGCGPTVVLACTHQEKMSTVTGSIFPERCRATRLCGQSVEELPPSPSFCY